MLAPGWRSKVACGFVWRCQTNVCRRGPMEGRNRWGMVRKEVGLLDEAVVGPQRDYWFNA
jgi:hypothetical protein